MDLTIRPARKEDMEIMESLLQVSNLNVEGINEKDTYFLVVEDVSGKIIGIAGFEKRGAYALLRSLVFDHKKWSSDVGIHFLATIIPFIRELNLKEIYLLTVPSTIELFEQLQFAVASLGDVPEEIKTSKHFVKTYHENVVIMRSLQFVKK